MLVGLRKFGYAILMSSSSTNNSEFDVDQSWPHPTRTKTSGSKHMVIRKRLNCSEGVALISIKQKQGRFAGSQI